MRTLEWQENERQRCWRELERLCRHGSILPLVRSLIRGSISLGSAGGPGCKQKLKGSHREGCQLPPAERGQHTTCSGAFGSISAAKAGGLWSSFWEMEKNPVEMGSLGSSVNSISRRFNFPHHREGSNPTFCTQNSELPPPVPRAAHLTCVCTLLCFSLP